MMVCRIRGAPVNDPNELTTTLNSRRNTSHVIYKSLVRIEGITYRNIDVQRSLAERTIRHRGGNCIKGTKVMRAVLVLLFYVTILMQTI